MFRQDELINEMEGLHKFAWRLTGNKPDADDLLQSTVLRALEKKHLFQDNTNLFRWTSKIMFHQFASSYRRKTKFESQYDPEPYIENSSTKPDQQTNLECSEMGDALAKLPKEQRDVIMLVCAKGLKYHQVADKLNIPLGTVRSRLARAREQLQNQ